VTLPAAHAAHLRAEADWFDAEGLPRAAELFRQAAGRAEKRGTQIEMEFEERSEEQDGL
jgi:hypothetical protein